MNAQPSRLSPDDALEPAIATRRAELDKLPKDSPESLACLQEIIRLNERLPNHRKAEFDATRMARAIN